MFSLQPLWQTILQIPPREFGIGRAMQVAESCTSRFAFCSREGALLLSSCRRPSSVVAGAGIGLGTTSRGPQPGRGLLGCGRYPAPDVSECLWRFVTPLAGILLGLSRARPPPPRPAFCAADAPHEHLHVHPQAHPGRHSFKACTSHVPAEVKERAPPASARAAAAGGPLMRWNGSVRCCGSRRCYSRCCCCCCGCCWAAAPRCRGWTKVQPLSDPPPGPGRRGSSRMSYGGGGVVGRSSSDNCPWLAGAAGSSKIVERGVLDGSTNEGIRGLSAAAAGGLVAVSYRRWWR